MKKLPSSLLIFAALLHADFQPSEWKYRRPITAAPGAAINVLTLDRETYVHSQPGVADVRVLHGSEEIPYVLEKISGSRQPHNVASAVLDRGVTPSGDLELIVDAGKDARHNGIRLLTPRTNYRQRVGIATSDDRRTWTRVRDDGYIFDFSQDNRQVSVRDITYPASVKRYVRVTVYGWNDPKAVTGCSVTLEESAPPERDTMATLKAEPEQEEKTQSTLFSWDLGVVDLPYDELTLDVETPAFQRAAVVETSQDGKQWYGAGQGVLSRFRKDAPVALDFPESHERYVRLHVYNRDDRPLAVKAAALRVVRTRLKFQAEAAGSYWLYYGNADAHAATYDLRTLLAHQAPVAEVAIRAGAEEPNPGYREKPAPAKPWSEQHPEILYTILALAVVVMGAVTVRYLKMAGEDRPRSG